MFVTVVVFDIIVVIMVIIIVVIIVVVIIVVIIVVVITVVVTVFVVIILVVIIVVIIIVVIVVIIIVVVVIIVVVCCFIQDMMAALNSELQCSQGTVGELKSAISDVSPFLLPYPTLPPPSFSHLVQPPLPHPFTLSSSQLVTENQALVEKNLSLKETQCQVCPCNYNGD